MAGKLDPPYLRIAAEIRRRIVDGELASGEHVPSTRQIAAEWGVALATATKALTVLRQQGLVCARPRSGTIVASPEPARGGARFRPTATGGPELSIERIVEAAIHIADREGLGALSMRGVAAQLGVAAMSPYRYVTSKDELIVMMSDAVFAESDLPDPPPPGWRARVEVEARALWACYRRHPWLAQLSPPTRPLPLPNLVRHANWVLAAFDGLGLDPATTRNLLVLVYSFVRGLAANLGQGSRAEAAAAGQAADRDHDALAPALAALTASGSYPALAKVTHVLSQRDDHLDLNEIFDLGVRVLLDGVAAGILHESRPGTAPVRAAGSL
ncbi:MAG: GntR family transcriptional regulator [Dactylosporangium sp.]|nr:TetR/AcrR family transcriptional regulator C-terminal domain-containing protein [Dactylosporangium sp.]NNJ61219.1 GntR family transcriptional regulator [Dactylosporangium sp.]